MTNTASVFEMYQHHSYKQVSYNFLPLLAYLSTLHLTVTWPVFEGNKLDSKRNLIR